MALGRRLDIGLGHSLIIRLGLRLIIRLGLRRGPCRTMHWCVRDGHSHDSHDSHRPLPSRLLVAWGPPALPKVRVRPSHNCIPYHNPVHDPYPNHEPWPESNRDCDHKDNLLT